MGKALVPVGPTLLVHFGPPYPYSLPKGEDFEDLAICQGNRTNLDCNQEFLDKTWLQCKAQKACQMTEYSMNVYKYCGLKDKIAIENDLKSIASALTDNQTKMLLDEPENSFMFLITFDHPDWSRGDEKLHVRILEEHLLWTGMDLVSMVGGQMGLFKGFSFMGTIVWLLNTVGGYCARFSNQKFT